MVRSDSGAVVSCRCSGGMEKIFAGIAVGSRQKLNRASSVVEMSNSHDGMVTRIDWT